MSVRLNKLLAQRGVGARRKCDELIQSGAVRVNGSVVLEPGLQIEPERDRITVRNQPLAGASALRHYVLNKPVGVITTLDDPEGRRTIREFMPPAPRLFPVGRLDADTSGLLILTNDGELAHKLMHPRYGVMKVYRVRLDRVPGTEGLRRLQEGVEFEPGVRSAPARVRVLADEPGDAMIEVALHEGRYRQVRRMCEAVGLTVRALHRSAYGPLRLGPVQRGVFRELSEEEVRRLRAACARPRQRGQGGYLSPRSGSDATYRLARRLEKMAAGSGMAPRPGGEEQGTGRRAPSPPGRGERHVASHTRPERPSRAERPVPSRDEWQAPDLAERPGPVRRERPPRPERFGSRGSGRAASRGPGRAQPRGPARQVPRSSGRRDLAGSGRPAMRGPGGPLSRGPGRPTPRGAARFAPRDSDRAPARDAGRPPMRGGSRFAPRDSGRPPARAAGRAPARASGRPPARAAGRAPARASGRPPGRAAGRAPARASGRPPGRAAGRAPVRASGRPAARGLGRPPVRTPGRPASRGSGRPLTRTSGQRPRRAGGGSASGRPARRPGRPGPR
jgi:23S rRNA pseudouridine2605 synthase